MAAKPEEQRARPERTDGLHLEPAGTDRVGDTQASGRLTAEARGGLMRAWIEVLRERHPGVTWVSVAHDDPRRLDSPPGTGSD